jgi:uncharacterized DUF497 family protein
MIEFRKYKGFDWDKGNLEHIKKHKVDYIECENVFSNEPIIITEDSKHSKVEKRYRVYGKTNRSRYLTIIITLRGDKIRVISARDQGKKERKEYLKKGGVN